MSEKAYFHNLELETNGNKLDNLYKDWQAKFVIFTQIPPWER